jgi:hypothetical protein
MLSIKAICKSENNEEVMIIGFELEGYCLCMTKSGTIFHAKHEDLTIVDKEYMESCAKGSIEFEMAEFLEKASARLDQIQSKQLTSIILELQEYRRKIEQGTLIELPCKVGDTVYCFNDYVWSDECGDCKHFEDGWYDSPCQCSKTRTSKKAAECIEIEEAVGITLKAIFSYMANGQFGKNVFLTREEAEKRLLELQWGKG